MQTLLTPKNHTKKAISHQTKKKTRIDSSDISLVLHTKTATQFFKQSWSYESDGLRRFACKMQLLWQAAKEGDPYAEWHLMQTYDQIGLLDDDFKQFEQTYQNYLNQKRGFEIVLFTNPNPFRFLLHFGNPFAYLATQLLADLDYTLRQFHTLKKIGILVTSDQLPNKLMTKLRKLFLQGKSWKYTGITREDIQQHNQRAKQAKEAMGKLPQVVLNREVQFGLLPKVQMRKIH